MAGQVTGMIEWSIYYCRGPTRGVARRFEKETIYYV